MVLVRATIVFGSATNLAKAATIAVRYSCVRRQTEAKPGYILAHCNKSYIIYFFQVKQRIYVLIYTNILHYSESELQVMDYVTQQHKLVPQVATSYAFAWIARYMMDTYHALFAEIQSGHLGALQEVRFDIERIRICLMHG